MLLSVDRVLLLAVLGLFAGWLGALVGIGGGVVIVPVLVLLFAFPIKMAVATSLVAVVATSTAAGSVYVGEGLSNMRLGMTLEIATTIGGITGGLLAVLVSPRLLSGLFGAMMGITAALMLRGRDSHGKAPSGPEADAPATPTPALKGSEEPGKLAGTYYDSFHGQIQHYQAVRLPVGAGISLLAGVVSGMLGVGGGFIKVPAMNLGMKVPIKVAAATSNFMIGVTAISSLFVYFARGLVYPLVAAPVALGVVVGALSGTSMAQKVSPRILRGILAVVLIVVAVEMVLKAVGVSPVH